MTEMDDLELSQRLRRLRVDPPQTGFEARLATRLQALTREPAQPELTQPAPRAEREGRVIVGPWMRRAPLRLIGATTLFLAGAAAAVEGGVVEWVRARVQVVAPAPAPSIPASPAAERANLPPRSARPVRETPAPVVPSNASRADEVPAPPPDPPREAVPSVPRLAPRRLEQARETAARPPERRPALDHPSVPRLEIDRRGHEGRSDPDTRLGRALGRPGESAVARERGRDLDRLRDIARARRERVGSEDRPRVLDRLRERRERLNANRREVQERGRPERRLR